MKIEIAKMVNQKKAQQVEVDLPEDQVTEQNSHMFKELYEEGKSKYDHDNTDFERLLPSESGERIPRFARKSSDFDLTG